MAGHAILNPICIHPLASPPSSPSSTSSLVSLDDDSLWDCGLLQPPSRTTSAATSLPASSSASADNYCVPDSPSCALRQRLMNVLNFTTEPSSTSPLQNTTTSYDPHAPACPALHRPINPAPPCTCTMFSPLTPAHAHKIAYSHPPHFSSPLPTMTFVAPAPRIPLADVLRHLDASWPTPGRSPVTPTPLRAHRHGDPHNVGATLASPRDGELPQLGLGLMMGAACVPIQLPRTRLELERESQSQTRYSRRLRDLAPAPLQLASSTPRAPFRTLTQTQTPLSAPLRTTTPTPASPTGTPPAVTQCAPALDNVSVSPQSDRKVSVSSTMDTQSTAPTSLAFPECSENVRPSKGTSVFSWQRPVVSQPLSPLSSKYAHAGPSNAAAGRAFRSPRTPSRRSSLEYANPFTPGLPPEAGPPPLRRSEWVPLPELHDDMNVEVETEIGVQPSPSVLILSPLRADLRGDLGVEDLQMRAEVCSETIARASMPLRSCSILREPESIAHLCNKLRDTFASVQRALDETPDDFTIDWSETKRTWYAKHWQVISSLDRNLNMFYLLAHQVEDRPPRIHRLAPILDKLSTYQAKFADLARRIVISHEKLRFLSLRDQLSVAHSHARHPFDVQRNALSGSGMLRHDARAARQEGRARRREIREELTRVRGRIRAIRERGLDPTGGNEDENAMPRNEDEDDDMIDDKTGDARAPWW